MMAANDPAEVARWRLQESIGGFVQGLFDISYMSGDEHVLRRGGFLSAVKIIAASETELVFEGDVVDVANTAMLDLL